MKVLRSLIENFSMKVTTIEEAQDVKNMRLDRLMGSLKTFEMHLNEKESEKKKIKVWISRIKSMEMIKICRSKLPNLLNFFGEFMKRMNRRGTNQGQESIPSEQN